MKIAVVGATGLTGRVIVAEAAMRGHSVRALSRHPEKTEAQLGVTAAACDVMDVAGLADAIAGHDWVVFSYSPRNDHATARSAPHAMATQAMIDAMRQAGVGFLFAMGGAGTLEVAPGQLVMDQPDFPPLYLESARSTAQIKPMLAAQDSFNWTYLSPPTFFIEDGVRTGHYQLGGDRLLVNAAGRSEISLPDLAVAVLDEIETPRHLGRRFTVAS